MTEINVILPLDGHLKASIFLRSKTRSTGDWIMRVQLYYDNKPAGVTSFTLRGYTQAEAESVVLGLPKNQYLMREIDEFLCGECD